MDVITHESAAWPDALRTIPSPPKQLHYDGDLAVLAKPCVAVVGSRNPTDYGLRVARDIAGALASAGACVVSGLAFGIDAAAHRAALAAGGATAAVLGTGIDVVYPAAHRRLHGEVAAAGIVLSESAAGTQPYKGCFPRRNRIIAGLSKLTIVVEAGAKSGSLITAGYALDFDRKVAAVPGQIDSAASAGSNLLLRDGANVITSVDDALSLLDLVTPAPAHLLPQLGADEATVWDIVRDSSPTADDIVARTGWGANRCLVAVTNLEVQGLVECTLAGEIRRR